MFVKIQDELLREKEMYQDRLAILEGKSDKFVQKFNELLDFTDHAEEVFHKSSDYQKRTIMKLCFDGFIVKNQKLTPIWTPVFDILMDLQSPTKFPTSNRLSRRKAQKALQTLRFKLGNLEVCSGQSSKLFRAKSK
ncbi:MAG: hypothetical protein COZ49_00870 [Candidatus Yonathbacteria bacterium CG_4_10_14_3_um_filter_47_65]|nr:MAG: hypothetical protein COW61_03625 [Candidatus Yonathbacteria bacterium CG17_big_fil_post_rev_8_21_14_2_50_46_19]PIX56669.1 MAG: hypothetical protein COZ49_00870 [Candidatus Yonathbacteria bacterium CG_4_10_14_3_um_filter_47_65]PJC20600.1 MAG: hypothetical protein CO061_02165 [Candidatus Yonathbacteria bacterium CG_4_9_14_0_2_um_filter_47_74]